jgi:hypothetical protein
MKTWRVISIVLMVSGLAGVAVAQPPALSLSFEPSSQTVGLGDSLGVGIRISGLGDFTEPSLGAFDLDVMFNPAVLDFTGAAFGDPVLGDQLDLTGLGAFTGFTGSLGSTNIWELSLDLPSDLETLQEDSFILATLSFGATGLGTSTLGMSVNALGDSLGNPLSATLGTGSVSVVPLPGAVLLGALGLGAAGGLLRRRQPNS